VPEFTYAGQVPVSYAEERDSDGSIVGTVEHGDTRSFGADGGEKPEDAPDWWPAPDSRWVPSGTEIGAAWPGVSAGMYRDQPAADDGSSDDAAPDSGSGVAPAAHDGEPSQDDPPASDEPPTTAGTGQEDEG
jgi:hypothetical protein